MKKELRELHRQIRKEMPPPEQVHKTRLPPAGGRRYCPDCGADLRDCFCEDIMDEDSYFPRH